MADLTYSVGDAGEEKWLPVIGYEGYYEVSNRGRVRSLPRDINMKNGVTRRLSGTVLLSAPSPRGYLAVHLNQGGRGKTTAIHSMVALAFVPNPDAKPFVCHRNDIKTDNRAENLYWGTRVENEADKARNGRNSWSNRTECVHGHPFDEKNTALDVRGGKVRRRCRECYRLQGVKKRARAKLAKAEGVDS